MICEWLCNYDICNSNGDPVEIETNIPEDQGGVVEIAAW